MNQLETRRLKSVDTAAIIVIAAFILFGCFGRTVITGKEISKLPVLASEDYFFNDSLRFTFQRPRFDPSLYQFHIPFQLYAQKEMSKFHLPLWNPCFGCGFPTLAELQYCTFSPFRGVFQATNPYLYNLGIAVKSLIAALSMFLLCRLFSFSTGSSSFAAIAYGLCPFILRELELPNEVQMFPLLSAAFVYLGNGKSFIKIVLLGACSAIALASMHPEFFFLATLNSLLILLAARQFSPAEAPMRVGKNILLAGLIGVCLSAPLLIPFVELVSNADSYKFHDFQIQKNFVQTLLAGLVTPVSKGGSAFLGVISIGAATFAVIFGKGKNLGLVAIALLLGTWCCLPEPLEKVQFLSLIPPRYLHAPLLMSLTLLAAQGVDLIVEKVRDREHKGLLCFALIAVFLAAAPFILLNSHAVLPGFDGTLAPPEVTKSEAIKGAISIALAMAVLIAAYFLRLPQKAFVLLPICLLAANLLSLGDASRTALAPTFGFTYRETGAIDEIRKSGERMTASSQFFFYPNIALSYSLRDFRAHGPLIPRWMAAIGKLSWARTADGKSAKWANRGFSISTIYDAASVVYIISRWPINSLGEAPLPYKPFSCLNGTPQHLIDPVVMKTGDYCLSNDGELFCKFEWQLKPEQTAHLAAELDILDETGKVLARGSRSELGKVGDANSTHFLSILVPEFQKRNSNLYLVLNLYSGLSESMLPLKTTMPMRANGIELLKITPQETDFTDRTGTRLRFVKADNEQILIYKNTTALPQAYLTTELDYANSLDSAIEKMAKSGFDAHQKTVIEAPDGLIEPAGSSGSGLKPAAVERPDAHTVSIKANASNDAVLVLTDTYYSGWHAYIDGKEVPIYRANVNFRGIKVPAGEHQISFKYIPYNFYAGVGIALAALILSSLIAAIKLRKGN